MAYMAIYDLITAIALSSLPTKLLLTLPQPHKLHHTCAVSFFASTPGLLSEWGVWFLFHFPQGSPQKFVSEIALP